MYCKGIAMDMPVTVSIKSNIMLIGIVKENNRSCLIDFSLEMYVHAKQFDALLNLN